MRNFKLVLVFFLSISNLIFSNEPSKDANAELAKYIHYSKDGPNSIGYLSIGMDRPIDQSTYIYVKFALESFWKKGVSFVVLDLNTPGGEVFAAQKIASLLRDSDVQHKVPVVAFINNWAISAGAMLAYSCRFIAITKSSSMGAAEPLMIKGTEVETASEKIKSALRSEFSNLASFYGRDPLLAEGMVDKDLILVLRKGKVVSLQDEKDIEKGSDIILSQKGKLLTLDAKKLLSLNVADFQVEPGQLYPLSEKEMETGNFPASKLLLFSYPFFASIPDATLFSYKDWRISFFSFLSNPIVASLLFAALMIGFYIEISTPGFGLPGSIALAALSLILLSGFSVHAVHWIELIILLSGILLLLLELFVIPGFGIPGVLGIILTIIGLVALMLPNFDFSFNSGGLNLAALAAWHSLMWLCFGLIVGFVTIALLARYLAPKIFLSSPLVLKGEQTGYVSGPDVTKLPPVGSKGKAFTSFAPSGKIEIDQEIYEAIAERGFIDKGKNLIIVRIEGNRVLVKEI